mgnify:CR=1 FL=1
MKILLIALAVFVAVGAISLIFKLLSGAVGTVSYTHLRAHET